MSEPNVFERRLAASLEAIAGPSRAIDAVEIARAAASRAERRSAPPWHRHLPTNRLLFAGLAATVAVAAAVAGSALLQVPTVSPTPARPTASAVPVPTAQRRPGWTSTGNMRVARYLAMGTSLPDGRVLVAGGDSGTGGPSLSSAELYDPTTQAWVDGPPMSARRAAGTATLLADGRVLITGGYDGYEATSSAEIYDPTTETWSATGSMGEPRADHTATVLLDGTVLVVGGKHKRSSTGFALTSAEVYDPATGIWHPTEFLSRSRIFHTASLLSDGQVLVAGAGQKGMRFDLGVTAELYDPATRRWSPTGSMLEGRGHHAAVLLPDGRVLVVGGNVPYKGPLHFDGWEAPLGSAEIYSSISGTWSAAGTMTEARARATAVLVNRVVLVLGSDIDADTTAEQFDVTTGRWSAIDPSLYQLESPLVVKLSDGTLLVACGSYGSAPLVSELYVPPS